MRVRECIYKSMNRTSEERVGYVYGMKRYEVPLAHGGVDEESLKRWFCMIYDPIYDTVYPFLTNVQRMRRDVKMTGMEMTQKQFESFFNVDIEGMRSEWSD